MEAAREGERRQALQSLTSLRWFAALAVFTRHLKFGPAWTWIQGASGVSFFFILSGFILMWATSAGSSRGTFYVRRASRILPAEFATTAAFVVLALVTATMRTPRDLALTLFTLTQLQSWVPLKLVYSAGNSVVWSLSDETFFYLLFPALAVVFRRAGSRILRRVAVLSVVVSLAVPLVLRPTDRGVRYWFAYVFPGTRLLEFVLGMCLCLLLQRGLLPRIPVAAAAALAVGAYAVAGVVPFYASFGATTLVPFALVIVAAAQADLDDRTPRLLASRSLRKLGQWSFAFYLVHWMLIDAWRRALRGTVGHAARLPFVVGSLALSLAAAALVFHWVEQPAERRLRAAWQARTTAAARVPGT